MAAVAGEFGAVHAAAAEGVPKTVAAKPCPRRAYAGQSLANSQARSNAAAARTEENAARIISELFSLRYAPRRS